MKHPKFEGDVSLQQVVESAVHSWRNSRGVYDSEMAERIIADIQPFLTEEEKTKPTLPTEPGIYTSEDQWADKGPLKDDYHTDGLCVWFLNTSGNWVDIGWGQPYDFKGPFTKMVPEVKND